jgi:2-phospho-L-lactate transferase/gluconeogenesis factor (CofD/UPF0052 family)
MWQPGETINFTAADHVKAIYDHAGDALIDYAIVNTRRITAPLKRRYAQESAKPVENDIKRMEDLGLKVVGLELTFESELVRHDPLAVAEIAVVIANEGKRRRLRKRA